MPNLKTPGKFLRIGLLGGFALSGIWSLYQSSKVYALINRAEALDKIAPHLGDGELSEEHERAAKRDAGALVSLGFAYGLYLTRTSAGPGEMKRVG